VGPPKNSPEVVLISTLRVLERIQRIDLEIKAIEDEEKRLCKTIEDLEVELKGSRGALASIEAEAEALKVQVKEIDEKIRESSERASKDEKRLNSVKNDRELTALTKEITGANKSKKQCEQEKSSLSAKIEEKEALLNARQDALKARKKSSTGFPASWRPTGAAGKRPSRQNSSQKTN
jgi:predicted  nucleic acid-binding Zn-ribbon protein